MHHPALQCFVATAAAFLLLAHGGPARAQAEPDCKNPTEKDVVACFSVDMSIPSSPGLAIVGLSPDDAVTPSTPRELGMALVNGTDREGRPKAGLALDFAPFKLLLPMTTRETYKNHYDRRLLWNTQMSIGTAKSTDASDKTQALGFGLRSLLWIDPKADPIQNDEHLQCLQKALAPPPPPPAAAGSGVAAPVVASAGAVDTSPAVQACHAKQARRANASAVSLSLAGSRVSPDGDWGSAVSGPQGLWLAGSYSLAPDDETEKHIGRNLMLAATLRRLWRELVPHPTTPGAEVSQSSTMLAVRLQHQSDKRAFHLEHSYMRTKPDGLEREHVRRTAVGVEWQIDKNLWIVAGFGGERGRVNDPSRSFVQTGLKFGTSDSPVLGAGPR
jgi:hypothetical protein